MICRLCPICDTTLIETGERYTVDELFELWRPVRFSEATLLEHRKQARGTARYVCPSCRLEIFLPQIIGTPRFYSEAYNLEGNQAETVVTYSTMKWDFDEAARDLPGLKRVLEVGCGPGHFLDIAARTVPHVEGVESNPVALEEARRRGHAVHASLDEITAGGQFDAAFLFHVLEHVRDAVSFLQEIAAQLRPGGLIGVSLPNQAGPIRFIQPCVQNMPPHHATRWQHRTFEKLVDRLGWQIVRFAYEPLPSNDRYYYIDYLPGYLFGGPGRGERVARQLCRNSLSVTLRLTFHLLEKLGKQTLGLLRGQSMYAAFRTPRRASS